MNRVYPQKIDKIKKFPDVRILSLLSGHVYCKEIQRGPVKFMNSEEWNEISETSWNEYLIDWKVIAIYGKNDSGGYFSVLYINEKCKQLALVTRGIVLNGFYKTAFYYINQSTFFKSDGYGMYCVKETYQKKIAIQTTKSVLEFARKIKFSLVLTGHSLGAWLSEIALFAITKEKSSRKHLVSLKVVAFESPGCMARFENMKAIFLKTTKKKSELQREELLNIVEYLSEPNLFNCGSEHLARRFYEMPIKNLGLGPVLSAADGNKEATIISGYTHLDQYCEVRAIKTIIEFFLHTQNDNSELGIMTEWPVISWTGLVTLQVKGSKSRVALSKEKSLANLIPCSPTWFLYKVSKQDFVPASFNFNEELLAVLENIQKNIAHKYVENNLFLRCLEGNIEKYEDEVADLITLYPVLKLALIENN